MNIPALILFVLNIMRFDGVRAAWCSALFLLFVPALALAQAHFAPGAASIRDYALPETGLYFAVYNYGYTTSELTDNNGKVRPFRDVFGVH